MGIMTTQSIKSDESDDFYQYNLFTRECIRHNKRVDTLGNLIEPVVLRAVLGTVGGTTSITPTDPIIVVAPIITDPVVTDPEPLPATVERIQVEYYISNFGDYNPDWESNQENLEAFVAANRISAYVEEWGDVAHQALFANVVTRLEEVWYSYEPYILSRANPAPVLSSEVFYYVKGAPSTGDDGLDTFAMRGPFYGWYYEGYGLATGRPTQILIGRTGSDSLTLYAEIFVQDTYVTIPNPNL